MTNTLQRTFLRSGLRPSRFTVKEQLMQAYCERGLKKSEMYGSKRVAVYQPDTTASCHEQIRYEADCPS